MLLRCFLMMRSCLIYTSAEFQNSVGAPNGNWTLSSRSVIYWVLPVAVDACCQNWTPLNRVLEFYDIGKINDLTQLQSSSCLSRKRKLFQLSIIVFLLNSLTAMTPLLDPNYRVWKLNPPILILTKIVTYQNN